MEKRRKEFPILSRRIHGKPLVYLDNAATTQKPISVIRSLTTYYELTNANAHRGVHTLAEEATEQMESARNRIARFIGAEDPQEVVFVRNTTEAINLAAYGWARKFIKPGDEVVLTEMEHHSNLVPWQRMAQDTGAKLRFIPVTDDGLLDLSKTAELFNAKTKLAAVTHMSNVLGTINPVQELARAAHGAGAKILLDGAQSVPHVPVNVKDLDCDFLAFSAHKMLGPMGLGVLWARREILESMDPFLTGGGMIGQVWPDHSTWAEIPGKFEAGTPNIIGAIATGVAVDYLTALGMENVREHEMELTAYAVKSLRERHPDVTLYGPADVHRRGGVVSFNVPGVHPHDVGTILDQEGVAIRAGHHCCQPLMRRLGVAGTARASFYIYNTRQEVDVFIDALENVKRIFKV